MRPRWQSWDVWGQHRAIERIQSQRWPVLLDPGHVKGGHNGSGLKQVWMVAHLCSKSRVMSWQLHLVWWFNVWIACQARNHLDNCRYPSIIVEIDLNLLHNELPHQSQIRLSRCWSCLGLVSHERRSGMQHVEAATSIYPNKAQTARRNICDMPLLTAMQYGSPHLHPAWRF